MKCKILPLLFISLSVSAFTCPKGKGTNARGIKAIAVELIRNEMSGARVQGMESHDCLKQEKFKFIKPMHSPSNEFMAKVDYVIDKSDIKLHDVKLVNKYINKYEANYSYKTLINKKEKVVTDQLLFIRNTATKNIFMYGCAFTTVGPTYLTLLKECSLEK